MRLYLSSFRLGDRSDRLVGLAHRPTAAVVANACDGSPPEERAASVVRELDALSGLGFDATEIDLRDFSGGGEDLREALSRIGVLWVRGGNVFTLRHALLHAAADAVVRDLVQDDLLVYAGYSAGACVLAPSLAGLERCDDAGEVMRLYGEQARFDGLGLLDRAVVPHLASPDHPESAALERVALGYRLAGVPYIGLRDGQVYLVEGGSTGII